MGIVEGRTEDDDDAERMGSVAAVAAAVVVVSTVVIDVESLMMSLRTTFRLRFFELLVDSATIAVVGAGDRVGEVITYRDCDCSCCCGCVMAGERTFSLVFPRMGVLDGVVVAVVGVRGVAIPASVDSKRRFFGVTTSSANNPTSFFFFFVDEVGEDR